MARAEVEDAVRSWLDRQRVNPATGVPPDARLSVSANRVTTFGTDRGPYTRLDAPAGYPTAVDVLLTVDDA